MKKRNIGTSKNTVKAIAFWNGFVEVRRDSDGGLTGCPGQLYTLKTYFKHMHKRMKKAKKPSMKRIKFHEPLPGLPF